MTTSFHPAGIISSNTTNEFNVKSHSAFTSVGPMATCLYLPDRVLYPSLCINIVSLVLLSAPKIHRIPLKHCRAAESLLKCQHLHRYSVLLKRVCKMLRILLGLFSFHQQNGGCTKSSFLPLYLFFYSVLPFIFRVLKEGGVMWGDFKNTLSNRVVQYTEYNYLG